MPRLTELLVAGTLVYGAIVNVQAADSARIKVPSGDGDIELKADTDGEDTAAELNGTSAEVEGGDTHVSGSNMDIKVESGGDGKPKVMACNAGRDDLRLTGQGSTLRVTGACKRVEVATTAAQVDIANAETVVISGEGNQVAAERLNRGEITGSGNVLKWAHGLTAKKPQLVNGDETNTVLHED